MWINVNDMVRVRLTPRGRSVLEDARLRRHASERDTNGVLRCQLHALMRIFGQKMVVGLDPCFVDNRVDFEEPR